MRCGRDLLRRANAAQGQQLQLGAMRTDLNSSGQEAPWLAEACESELHAVRSAAVFCGRRVHTVGVSHNRNTKRTGCMLFKHQSRLLASAVAVELS